MLAMALKPFGERSFVRLMKLPAALLTRPVRGPSLKTRVIMFSTASGDRMSHSIGVTRVLCVSASSRAVSATTAPRRPQMYTSAPSLAYSPAISRPSPVPPPVTRMRLPLSRSARKIVMPFPLDPTVCAPTGSGGWSACSAPLGVEAAAVDVSCPPEQIVPLNIDQVVLHEVAALGQAERRERLPENALTLPCLPRREPGRRHRVEEIRKARDHRRDLVRLVRDEVRLLCVAGDRVLADPLDMSAQVDASDCHLAVRVCPVTDGELEPVVAEVLELAAEIERLQRSVRVPGPAGTHLRRHTHPLTDADSHRVLPRHR